MSDPHASQRVRPVPGVEVASSHDGHASQVVRLMSGLVVGSSHDPHASQVVRFPSDCALLDFSLVDASWSNTVLNNSARSIWGDGWNNRAWWVDPLPLGYMMHTEVGVVDGLAYLRLYTPTVINSNASARTRVDGPHTDPLGTGFVLTTKFKFEGDQVSNFWTMGISGFDLWDRWVIDDEGMWDYSTANESPGTVYKHYPFGAMARGRWYHARWEYRPGFVYPEARTDYPHPGTNRIKVWRDRDPEPAGWLIDTTGVGGAGVVLGAGGSVYVTLSSPGNGPNNTIWFEYIRICP